MAASKPHELLMLQPSSSLVRVLCLYFHACVFPSFVYLLYQLMKQTQEVGPGQGETHRFCLDEMQHSCELTAPQMDSGWCHVLIPTLQAELRLDELRGGD